MKKWFLIVFLSVSCLCVQGINALHDSVSAFLQTKNGLLPSQRLYEENERNVNEIYFSTLLVGIDSFTVSQRYNLYRIANQCPISGGKGVYYARSLVRLFNDSIDYDDKALCFAEGISYRHAQNTVTNNNPLVKAYPNPNNGLLTLEWQKGANGNTKVSLINPLGVNCLNEYNALEGNNLQTISTKQLANGIYYLHIYLNNQLIESQKLIIAK